jgi:hypothetical protein
MQWRAMHKQANYMRDNLALTKQSADAAAANAQALINAERAWLDIYFVRDHADLCSVRAKNHGRTPAHIIDVTLTANYSHIIGGPDQPPNNIVQTRKETKNGSAQESDEVRILSGFPKCA